MPGSNCEGLVRELKCDMLLERSLHLQEVTGGVAADMPKGTFEPKDRIVEMNGPLTYQSGDQALAMSCHG